MDQTAILEGATAAGKPLGAQNAELPSGIDGLDMQSGLRRVLGNKPRYLSMLRNFVDEQKFVTTKILKALEDNDWDTAEQISHDLKGQRVILALPVCSRWQKGSRP